MPLIKLTFKPGIDKENTNYANEGGWYNCDKIRFRSGSPEKVGGWTNYSTASTFNGVTHSMVNWTTYSSENLLAFGTNQEYYVEYGGIYNDITPLQNTNYLGINTPLILANNPFSTTNGSKLVTVTAVGHGLTINTFVTFTNATAVGGLTLNGEFEIVGVPDGNSYQIVSSTAASSTATGGGAVVTAQYELNAGSAITTVLVGWGGGVWGGGSTGTWGFSGGGITNPLRLWSQSIYLQDVVFAPLGGVIYYWPKDTSSFARAKTLAQMANGAAPYNLIKTSSAGTSPGVGSSFDVDDSDFIDPGAIVVGVNVTSGTYVTSVSGSTVFLSAPTTGAASGTYTFSYAGLAVPNATNYVIASDIQRFTIALGANPYDPTNFSTTFDPMLVRWSDQDNPYDWTPTTSNQSGEQHLSSGSYLVCGNSTRQEILVFSNSALYSMQYLGPPYVWGFNLIAENISIASSNAATTVNNVTYWMGTDKFYQYAGRVDTLPCSLKRFVYNNINVSQIQQVVSGSNEGFDEVWWFYPSLNSNVNDSYIIYNYVDRIWYYGTLNRSAWLDSPLRSNPMAAFSVMDSYLSTDINSSVTSVSLVDGTSYPSSGYIQIDSEYISYTAISGNTLLGCTRGATFSGVPSVAASHTAYTPAGYAITNQIIFHEYGNDDATIPVPMAIPSYLESSDYDISDGQQIAFVWRIIPDFTFDGSTATNPQVILTIRPRINPGSAYVTPVDQPSVTRTASYPVELYTGQVYTRIRGRQMSFRVDSSMLGVKWQMGNSRADMRTDGRR